VGLARAEVLQDPTVIARMSDTKALAEVRALGDFFQVRTVTAAPTVRLAAHPEPMLGRARSRARCAP